MEINTETKLIGLLGYPLGHSYSPVMQNAALKKCNLNKLYIPIEVKPKNLEAVVKGISKMNFDGFNVTIPYKIDIMKYLDQIDEEARLIGAVNTVKVSDGNLKGYNTDGRGFLRSFEENTGTSIKGKNIFILGSGGAARAIGVTMALNGAAKIYICNRTYERAKHLAYDINKISKAIVVPKENEKIKKAIEDSNILINTTSVGMLPNIDQIPLNINLFNKNLIVCDIIYNPLRTKLLKAAEDKGCKTLPGLPMLVYQGGEAFEIWTGLKAPIDTMFRALEEY